MKSLRNRILAAAALGLGIFSASAIPAAAQTNVCKGSFTLPVAVQWQSIKLPAGSYTFSIKSFGTPTLIRLEGQDGAVYVEAITTSERDAGNQSFIALKQRGGNEFVSELYLAQFGLHVLYYVPKETKDEPLAKVPAQTKRIAVLAASN